MTTLYTYTPRVMQKFLEQKVALEREKFKKATYREDHVFLPVSMCFVPSLALLEGGGAKGGAA